MKAKHGFTVIALCLCCTKTISGCAQFERYGLTKKACEGRFLVYAQETQVAQSVKNKIRNLYEDITNKLGYTGAFKTKYQILIWQDQNRYQSFLKAQGLRLQAKAFFISKFKGFPTIIACTDKDNLQRALLHEFTHLALREICGSFTKKPQLWLDEGMANYLGSPMLSQHKEPLKEKLRQGKAIPLATLISMKKYPENREKKTLFYIESESLVSFLFASERKKGDFYSFFRRYVNQGNLFTQAYSYAFTRAGSIKKIEEKWIKYINGL